MDKDVNGAGLLSGENSEKRGTWFIKAGHTLAVFIIIAFAAVYALRSFQFDRWQSYFFMGTLNLKNSCEYAATSTDFPGFPDSLNRADTKTLAIPHSFDAIKDSLGDKSNYHMIINCSHATTELKNTQGVPYLHIGWVYSANTEIYINNELRLTFKGVDKPSIPISFDDLRNENVSITFRFSSPKTSKFGLAGLAPLVIATDVNSNFRIFGLETAMQNITPLYALLPLLTLGLLLSFGWLYGIRSRLMITTFFFFGISLAGYCFPLFIDFFPWDFNTTYRLTKPFHTSKWLAFLLFGMELIQWRPRHIPKIMLAILTLIVIQIIIIAMSNDSKEFVTFIVRSYRMITIAGAIFLAAVTFKKLRDPGTYNFHVIFKGFIFLTVASTLVLISDTIIDYFRLPIFINHYVDLFMPLFIGGLLLYSLGLSEKNYQTERTRRIIIEQDLALAHEIQDSLAPPPNYFHKGGIKINSFQIKHSAVAGDWMAFREMPNGEHILVVADATGKGVQAALIVHAVQSLWADVLHDEKFSPSEWMTRVNRTLYTLGQRKPHSMTMGIVSILGNRIEYYCAGHVPLFVVNQTTDQVIPMIVQNKVLGLSEQVLIKPSVLNFTDDDKLTILLGTDGVFDKGSRTSKRAVLGLLANVVAKGTQALDEVQVIDDKTLIIAETHCESAA